MDFYRKIERSVTISADKRSTIDLQVDIWSQDLNVTKFVLKLDTADSTPIDLTNAVVRVAIVYNQDGQDVKIEAAGIVEDVATQKIAYVMSDKLAGFEGEVTAGFYVTLKTGQRIDIQNVTFNMCKSLLDKDLEAATENYYQTFDDIAKDVRNQADTQKSAMLAKTNEVTSYGDTQKTAMNNIVKDVQSTGNTAKTQIGQVLPDVQSKVSAINTELAKIDENMPDLFVAYADDANGGGFSKTDSAKLFKGYGIKNSNSPTDYRWERNVDNLQVGAWNLLHGTKNFGSKYWGSPSYVKADTDGFSYVELLNGFSQYLSCYFELKRGTYTISFYAKCETNQTVEFKNNATNVPFFTKLIDSRDWKKYVVTINVASDTTTSMLILTRQNTNIVYLKKINWVEGNVEKAWGPSLDDQQSQIDNIQIGGRNLLLHSEVNESNMGYFEKQNATAEVVTEGSLKYYKIKINDGVSGNNNGIRIANNYGYYNLTKGKHYIFSYWIKTNIDYGFAFNSIGHHQVANGTNSHTEINSKYNVSRLIANEWTKVTIEFDTTVDAFFIPYIWFVESGIEICVYGMMLEEGNTPSAWSQAPEETILNSNPINSILTTLSGENPSTTLGGTWTQLGTETKFNQTIYYWKRTN